MNIFESFQPATESEKIISFLKEIFAKTGKSKAVIALSGGIDSTTSFLLLLKALGLDAILPIHLPSKRSNPVHTQDVHALLDSTGFPKDQLTTIPIGGMIQKTWRIIGKNTPNEAISPNTPNRRKTNADLAHINHLRLANISARIRMIAIFDHAKRHDALVVGTENHSEALLGYFTRFGDEASDIEPIQHLYKTQVIALAKYLSAPQSIIEKPPSADLWVGQTDEKEMGFSYEQADPILYLYDQGKKKQEINAQGYDIDLVNKITSSVRANHFKHLVPYTIK